MSDTHSIPDATSVGTGKPLLGFRLLSLNASFEGHPGAACARLLHPLFASAKNITIFAKEPSIQSIAAVTCGMQPLVGNAIPVKMVLVASEEIPSRDKPIGPFIERLGIYTHLRKKNLFECHIFPASHDTPTDFALLDNEPLVLLSDERGDSVIIKWEKQLPFGSSEPLAFSVSWSFGDPLNKVKNVKSGLDKLLSSALEIPTSEWLKSFHEILDSIDSTEPPYEETFPDEQSVSVGITLYEHQKQAIDSWVANGRKGIFKMCTGSGKTITSLFAINSAEPRFGPILVTVPTRVLADQWSEQIRRLGYSKILMAYENAGGWMGLLEPWLKSQSDESPRFVVTTYKTFADDRFLKKIDRFVDSGFSGVWIADEMHNLASTRLMEATQRVGRAFPQRIGLSATPEIEGNDSMTTRLFDFFGGIVATYNLKEGIEDGVLCRYRYHPFPAYLDPVRGSEYIRTLQSIDSQGTPPARLMDLYRQSRELIRRSGVQLPALDSILDRLIASGEDLKNTLVYCPPGFSGRSADQTDEIESDESEARLLEEVVSALRKRGLSVSSILGETPKTQRGEILKRFSAGSLDVLCAIGCLDEGIDIPSIRRAIVLYSIDREKQFVQRRGRILRTIRGTSKTADIYDVVILPHGTDMSPADTERLLNKELRRYRAFSDLALNATEAHQTIQTALTTATEVKI